MITSKKMSCGSFSSSSRNGHSNLEHFLYCVTPIVPSRTVSQSYIADLNSIWQPHNKEKIQYFTLGDLWDRYSEWSAYGVQTPVLLRTGETISHYFVPYLSALQIHSYKPIVASRNSDPGEFESDCWSDDSGGDDRLSRSLSNNSSRGGWDVVSEDSSVDLESSWPARQHNSNNKLGSLYLHYVETSHPHLRPPLIEKVTELAQNYPGLMTLKSVDLGPASWMAVAWYPIYSIPCRKNEKDLSASFLTYHTLSSSFEDWATENGSANMEEEDTSSMREKSGADSFYDISSLFPFGLATYKMEGDLWLNVGKPDYERKINLYNAADSWLKQLNVHHHDFNFFTHHLVK